MNKPKYECLEETTFSAVARCEDDALTNRIYARNGSLWMTRNHRVHKYKFDGTYMGEADTRRDVFAFDVDARNNVYYTEYPARANIFVNRGKIRRVMRNGCIVCLLRVNDVSRCLLALVICTSISLLPVLVSYHGKEERVHENLQSMQVEVNSRGDILLLVRTAEIPAIRVLTKDYEELFTFTPPAYGAFSVDMFDRVLIQHDSVIWAIEPGTRGCKKVFEMGEDDYDVICGACAHEMSVYIITRDSDSVIVLTECNKKQRCVFL